MIKKLINKIKKNLTPDLLRGRWKDQKHPLQGHCYVATEALYHLLPNRKEYKIMVASYYDDKGKATHWYLEHKKTGKILDITAKQFLIPNPPPYHLGKPKGFLTKNPSKRTIKLLNKLN